PLSLSSPAAATSRIGCLSQCPGRARGNTREKTRSMGADRSETRKRTMAAAEDDTTPQGEHHDQRKKPNLLETADPDEDEEETALDEESDDQDRFPDTIYFHPPTRFNTPELLPLREPGTKAVRSASKFLVGLSSSLDGEQLNWCSGFWIDWNQGSRTAIVLTTAHLIRTEEPERGDSVWLEEQEYAPHANVTVHLLDGNTAEGQLLYHQPHYELAFFRVTLDQPIPLPCFNEEVKFAQDVLHLGRDKSLDLRITQGRAAYLNPVHTERYHYVYLRSEGPVIDLNGKVVGLFNISTRGSFIPSSILLKCWDSWKNYGAIFRPHLGLTFKAIKLLEPGRVDKIWPFLRVSKGSRAQKLGIREGDIIESFNGECISTTMELENMLLSICKGPFVDLTAKVRISVGVFHIRKQLRRNVVFNVVLTANVSEHGEIVLISLELGVGKWMSVCWRL
ncbi:hypothetical protein BRADI_4g00700v3, partial [Brachypodium distachyon]